MEDTMIKAIIFDMDGVLVDSEPVIETAAIKGLMEYGVNAKAEDFREFVGSGEDLYIGGVARKYGITYIPEMKSRVYEIYLDLVESNLKLYDDVLPTLIKLKKEGYKIALASSADRIKIFANLKVAQIPINIFDVILGGDDVVEKKPSPEIYIKAAKQVGVGTEESLVIEDSLNGVRAAILAGASCIGITTSFTLNLLYERGANIVVNNLSEIHTHLENI